MKIAVPLYHGGILAEILDKIGIELTRILREALVILIDTEAMKKMAKYHTHDPGAHMTIRAHFEGNHRISCFQNHMFSKCDVF